MVYRVKIGRCSTRSAPSGSRWQRGSPAGRARAG